MSQQAQVTSVEALDLFRAQLIVFIEKTKMAVDDILDDVARTRNWMENDQRLVWHGRARRYAKELETARAEEFSSRLSNIKVNSTAKKMAVSRAKHGLQEAEDKLVVLKRWLQRYDAEVAPSCMQVEKLRACIATDLRDAVALLARTIETLETYASQGAPAGTPAAPAAPGTPEGAAS